MCVHLLPSLPLVFPCSSLLRAAWCCLSLSSTASLHPVLSLFCTALPCSCCCSRLAFRVPVAPGNSLALRCPPSVFSLANVAQAVARACFPKWPPCLSAFVLRFVGRLVRRGWGGGVILRVRFHTCPCLFTLLHLFMLSSSDFLSCLCSSFLVLLASHTECALCFAFRRFDGRKSNGCKYDTITHTEARRTQAQASTNGHSQHDCLHTLHRNV